MNVDTREAHIRKMLEHGEKVQQRFRQRNQEFEKGCRAFWDFMRRVTLQQKQRRIP